jgi:hypothetical protein
MAITVWNGLGGIAAEGDAHDAFTAVRLSAGIWRRLLRAASKKGILP